jgi:hypothetical protein
VKMDWQALHSVLNICVLLFAVGWLEGLSVLMGFGKPDPSVLAASVTGEGESSRFSSRTNFDSSSRLILHTKKWTTTTPRGKEHYYLQATASQGGSLPLAWKDVTLGLRPSLKLLSSRGNGELIRGGRNMAHERQSK